MITSMRLFASFLSDERGTESVEWGMIAGLIVGMIVLAVIVIGVWSVEQFESLQESLESST